MASGAIPGFGGSMMVPFRVKGDQPERPPMNIRIDDLIGLPAACKILVDQVPLLYWPDVMNCAKEVLGVSAACVDCLPRFGKQVKVECADKCMGELDEVAESIERVGQATTEQV